MLKNVVVTLILLLWPLNLYQHNTFDNYIAYVIPAAILAIAFLMSRKDDDNYFIPILTIGLFEKKFLILPVLFFTFIILSKFTRKTMLFLLSSILILVVFFKPFWGQTIFYKDYEAEQLVLRNIHLYPNAILARVFQNKPLIILDKLSYNFFALTDPNNYFFAFHPRPIPLENQNMFKYPFVALVFLIYGVLYIKENKNYKFIVTVFFASLVSLIILKNFDRNDFLLWVPLSLVCVHGINTLKKNNQKLYKWSSLVFAIFAIPEIIRALIK